ncbi:ubiquinol-cytochrome c reductase cytochrome b subunit [Brevibacterium iodinum ATCC 49514]|uniref:Cytochrome bc1 complex cytochrome b subunit n=1 Tax=Brevibacterium iodinum ATCC 49514 TaxID=1255616 RepID=A0A2H1KKT2_9MICO|nr:cytochrome b N-terminal domain-containing protein [Brevibacterium iodinum]SMY00423.1 ubiquinol-cytochrome c reductase cytochrome b subunit [Brevibacterium iodinum ATCC 49514]SUW70196.1 Cytochrome b6 [Brevibacterium iodinum]
MPREHLPKTGAVDRVGSWKDKRVRASTWLVSLKTKVLPDHWSFFFVHIALASFTVCMLSGVFLMFFYDPSVVTSSYQGQYEPLRGIEASRAFISTIELSFEVRGGLLMRQLHSWSASLMIASLILHILRVFFSAEFRKPREIAWMALLGCLITAMMAGLTGHFLPDDMLSGSSLAVLDGVLKATPVIGTTLSSLLFQGNFPSGAIATVYPMHILILPVLIALFGVVVAFQSIRHKPSQFPLPGRSENNIVGKSLAPAAVKRIGLMLMTTGMLFLIAATVTINPIWNYGPADPGNASAGGGALWFVAFLDGAQRLVPSGWEIVLTGYTITLAILVPVVVCGLFFVTAILYPFIESWISADERDHHLLVRPRNAPARTGLGVAAIVFYGVLWIAAGSDVIALYFFLSNEDVILVLQISLFLGPIVGFSIARRICLALQRKDKEIVLHGFETGKIVRLPSGEYQEIHAPVDEFQRWKLVTYESPSPLHPRPDESGRIRIRERARAFFSRLFFEDRVVPPSPDEVRELRGHSAATPQATQVSETPRTDGSGLCGDTARRSR